MRHFHRHVNHNGGWMLVYILLSRIHLMRVDDLIRWTETDTLEEQGVA